MTGVKTSGLQMDTTRLAEGYFEREASTCQHRVSCHVSDPQSPFRSAYCSIYVHNLESWVRTLLILQEETLSFLLWGGGRRVEFFGGEI